MATVIRRGKLQELEQQERIGDGPADWPLVHSTFYMPVGSAWQTNWIATFILLVLILLLAALAFAFALAGFLQTKHVDKDTDKLLKNVTGLHAVCQRTDCIGIWSLPISLEGGNCYVLKQNLTMSSGDGILIVGQTDIDLCYANHNIRVIGAFVPVLIHNSTGIRVHNPYHHTTTSQTSVNSAGIRVQLNTLTNSTAIFIYSPVMINFRTGVRAQNADITVFDPYIFNAWSKPSLSVPSGMSTTNMINLVVKGGFISLPLIVGNDSFSGGIFVLSNSKSVDIDGTTMLNCGQGMFLVANNLRLAHLRITVDPLAVAFANAFQIGAGGLASNVIIEDVHADCSGGAKGIDCVLLWNARSLVVDGLTVVGSVPPLPGVYTGGMVSISSEVVPGSGPLTWRAEAYDLRKITIRMTDDVSIGLHINTGIMLANTRNTSVSVRDSTIHGGLVGVLLAGHAHHVMLQSVTVSDAPYCFVATNGTRTVTMKDCDAFKCCLGYWASPQSRGIGVYESRATTCGISYLDDGTNCELSTGAGSEGNNRLLDETGPFCTLPPLPFGPDVILLDVNNTVLNEGLNLRYGFIDGGNWFDMLESTSTSS